MSLWCVRCGRALQGAPIAQQRTWAVLKSSSSLCSIKGKAMLKLPNANECAKRLSAARRSSTSRPLSNRRGRNKPVCIWLWYQLLLTVIIFFFLSCSLVLAQVFVGGFVILPPHAGRASGVRAFWRQRAVSFSVCWVAVGKGLCCFLVHTVLAAGFYSHSVACFYDSAPAFPLSVSAVFVFIPLLALEHKLWALHAGQAEHPCGCFWGVLNLG